MKVKNIRIGDTVYIKRYVCSVYKDIPLIVESISKSSSGKTFYFHLSNGRKYSNGNLVSTPCLDKNCSNCKNSRGEANE